MAKSDNLENDPGLPDSDQNAISNPGKTPGPPSTNPFSQGRTGTTGGTGGVNPSGPTTGTEGWGLGANESKTTGKGEGRLGSSSPGKPQANSSRSPQAGETTGRGTSAEENVRGSERDVKPFSSERDQEPLGERTFRCSDVGNADCRWETSAQTEEDLMDRIERHGREAHGIKNFDDETRKKVIDVIRQRRAA